MRVSIILEALTGSFETDMKRASKATEKAAREMEKNLKESGKAIGEAFAIAATAVAVLVKSSINSFDQLSKMSQKVGVSVEALSALKVQAGLADVEIEGLQTGLVKFSKIISEAAGGGKTQAAAFKAIGVSLMDVNGQLKPTEALLAEVADKFQGYKDGASKAALAVALFGRAGADLIPMLNEGADGMAAAREEAEKFGQVIGAETAKQAEQFNDNLTRAGLLVTGFGNQIAAKLLPALSNLSDQYIDAAKESHGFEDAADAVVTVLKTLARAAILVKGAIEVMVNFLAAGVDILIGFAKIAKSVAEGLGQATAGAILTIKGDLAGADAAFDQSKKTFSTGWDEGAEKIKSAISAATSGVGEIISRNGELIDALDAPLKKVAERGKDFQNVIAGIGPLVEKTNAPIIDLAGNAEKSADAFAKLQEKIADGQQKLEAMANGITAHLDPESEILAKFRNEVVELGQVAQEQFDKIEQARTSPGGSDAEAAAQQAAAQDALTLGLHNLIAVRDQDISSIERQHDVTALVLNDLAAEARLIGMTASQRRIEETVLRAVAEAKKQNAAAGREIVKVDEARIRQAAKLNEALNLAASINVKSPLFEMIDQAKELGDALKKGLEEGLDPELLKPLQDAIAKTNAQIQNESIGSFKALLGAVQTFSKEGSSGFKSMEKGMAALSIVQDLIAIKAAVTAVLTQGEGEPYSAWARMAAMAAAVAPLLASIGASISVFGGGSGGPSSNSAEVRQAVQGTGSVLGDADAKSESIANAVEITANATEQLVGINRGMLRALQGLQAALGDAGGMIARGAGNVDFPKESGGGLFLGLFGSSKTIIDQGIIIAGGTLQSMLDNIVVGAYQTIHNNGGLFGGSSDHDNVVNISDEFARQFQLIIGSIADTVREGAEALGILPAEIEAAMAAFRVEEIRISLKDLTAEEQQAELEAVFSRMFDGLAGAVVPFIEQFQQVGEGLGETLIRIATEVQVVQEGMRQLGLAIDEADPERFAQISDALITAVGGIDAFISGMQSFVANFASDADKLSVATAAINSAFEQAGLTVPATDEAMWALMQTLDATTEEGQQQIATLLRLSDTARQYYDLLDKAEKARLDYIRKSIDIQAELNPSGGFIGGRMDIEQWAADTAQSLNDLARAAGRSGAATRDLTNVQNVAAQRLAQLIEKLKGELRDLAVTLGYTTQADTIESLTSQIESMSSASSDAAGAIGSAIDSMREKMNLLLGDLSPFNDQKKLELALEGLRAGTVDASTVLEIGRRLYASTSNYTNLFNQVMGMAQFGQPDIGSAGGATEAQGRTLAELIAARDALLAAQRPEMADELARRLAELAYATGEDFAAIAEQQGFTLDQLGEDLNLNSEQLTAYLDQLQSQFEEQDFAQVGQMFQFEIRSSTDRIVAAITGEPSKALEESDQRMQQITDQQAADRAASDQRVVDAIDRQTSAIIAASSGDSAELAQILDLTRRDLRETFNGVIASGERGRFNTPLQIR